MIHENIVLDEKTGSYEFMDFVRDEKKMAKLFENFIRNFFKEELKHTDYEVSSETIKWKVTEPDPISMEFLPIMKTDISITSSNKKLIIDTKYYKECLNEHYDRDKIITDNLYQIFAYVKNAEYQGGAAANSDGMLLYPTVTKELYLPYQMENHKIIIKTINLNQNWKLVREDLLRVVN
jgi:5-methylcytosine-specific restriction enzyme subunit McrC